jgi:hypothetical protein
MLCCGVRVRLLAHGLTANFFLGNPNRFHL